MRYRCLIMDHDDTTVSSTANIHYPSFVEYMKLVRPQLSVSLEEYVKYNFEPGILPYFVDVLKLTEEEIREEQDFWVEFTKNHVSDAFAGIRELLIRHKEEGGILVVVSHSFADNIRRDYAHNHLPDPDLIFGWEQPKEERKPSPVPVQKVMERFCLKPEEILVVDDLKPGLVMSRAAGVDFAGAGWGFDIPENEAYMRENANYYFKTVEELSSFLEA